MNLWDIVHTHFQVSNLKKQCAYEYVVNNSQSINYERFNYFKFQQICLNIKRGDFLCDLFASFTITQQTCQR